MESHRRTACVECAVKDGALCKVLSPGHLAGLKRRSQRRHFPRGQILTGIRDMDAWCATILAGVVKLSKSLPDGRQQIVALLFPSDFLGRPFKGTHPYIAETATAVELCCYSQHYFEALLAEQPELNQLFLERTLDAIDASREWMLLLGRKTAREKLAALLMVILRRTQPQECDGCATSESRQIELPLSRAEMADYLGLRLETVSRQLNQLQALGVIKRIHGRGIAVLDMRHLEQMSGIGRTSPSTRP